MFRSAFVYFALLSLSLSFSCSNLAFFQQQDRSAFGVITSIPQGTSLHAQSEFNVQVDHSSLIDIPENLQINFSRNNEVEHTLNLDVSADRTLETFELTENISDLDLERDLYSVDFALLSAGQQLALYESWFYYTEEKIALNYVSIVPHSARVGQNIEIIAHLDLPPAYEEDVFAQVRINDELFQELRAEGDVLSFTIDSLTRAGVYNISLDLFPWYSRLIQEDTRANYNYDMELIVYPASDEHEQIEGREHRIQTTEALRIEDTLLFYEEEYIRSRIRLPHLPSSDYDSVFFSVSDENLLVELQNNPEEGDEILLRLRSLSGAAERAILVESRLDSVELLLYESDIHFTLLILQNERVMWGEIIPFSELRYEKAEESLQQEALNEESESEEAEDAPSHFTPSLFVFNMSAGQLRISNMSETISLFKQISQLNYGNFLLYADGFEFMPEATNELQASENIVHSPSFLEIMPGESLEFPDITIDTQNLIVELAFHSEDNLSGLEVQLLQNGEERFAIIGQEALRIARDTQEITLGSELHFAVYSENSATTLSINEGDFDLASVIDSNTQSNYSIRILNRADSQHSIRLDSLVLSNKAADFVDQVLNKLP